MKLKRKRTPVFNQDGSIAAYIEETLEDVYKAALERIMEIWIDGGATAHDISFKMFKVAVSAIA